MKGMLASFYARPLAAYLITAVLALSAAAGPAEAMLVPAASSPDRSADLATVQKALESQELRQRLLDYGLTPEETDARIAALPDEQLHRFAADLDSVQAGGDAIGALFTLAVIAALVVLIIFLLEGRIEIRKK